jgi:superfamily II DNA or RNA helicase
MGITNTTLLDRDGQYATGEVTRGCFQLVIEMPQQYTRIVEKCLGNHFFILGHHIQLDGGTEFYRHEIMDLVVPFLEKTKIEFRILSPQEIEDTQRAKRLSRLIEKLKTIFAHKILFKNTTNPTDQNTLYVPRPDQKIIIDDSVKYFETNDKGLLILMCGVGKSLISLWISQCLCANTLLIGVPNILLANQWNAVLQPFFSEMPILLVMGLVSDTDIQRFLQRHRERCIVITTYSSSHKVKTATLRSSFTFQMKILDEVHHLTSHNIRTEGSTSACFVEILKVPSIKQLGLTATIKLLEDSEHDDAIISNDNAVHFGAIIEQKGLLWAIQRNIICDYVVQTIIVGENKLECFFERFGIIDKLSKRLFLSAYCSLRSISDRKSHHLIVYSNNKENSVKIIRFIQLLLKHGVFIIPDLFCSVYHSDIKQQTQKNILKDFQNSESGIISCVFCLGEGWDFPLLDGVVFAENMTSLIRIIQSALRAMRKNKEEPDKIAKIILSVLECEVDWLEDTDNPDLKKVKEVIYQMGDDETIAHKVRCSRLTIENPDQPKQPEKLTIATTEDFGDYDEELTQKLRLRTTARSALKTGYQKVRKILVQKNVKSKEQYVEACHTDNRLPHDPEMFFQNYCFRNFDWFEFLSIPRIPGVYYEMEVCKLKVSHYLTQHNLLRNGFLDIIALCDELCQYDDKFPPKGLWKEYYKAKDLGEIIAVEPRKRKKSPLI